jgi:HSP20 family molecular chaperone IbpA
VSDAIIHYVQNHAARLRGSSTDPAYDCVTEIGFEDLAGMKRWSDWYLGDEGKILRDDEENFMDPRQRVVIVTDERHPADRRCQSPAAIGTSTACVPARSLDVVPTSRPSPEEVRATTAETALSMTPQNVPVNAYRTPGAFVIVAPFPAVTENDVSIELTADGVRFSAELRSSGPREYDLHEWEYGGYERSVETPAGFGSGVEASLANGQLVVRVLSGDFTANQLIRPTSNAAAQAMGDEPDHKV